MIVHAYWAGGVGSEQLCNVSLYGRGELRQLERLLDEIVGACLQSLPLVDPIVESRDHDDAHVLAERWMLLDVAANLPAIAARHHHVEQNQRRLDLLERLDRLIAVVRDGYRIPARLQIIADDVRVIGVVVHYEDRGMR